ncbi:carboxypeptidase-like regulatory domain-containing protein [Flavobacterium poyangense]|uniref:carboxypeptidase-like regulatory domain-containing protein n=1 Tax=Flavobacterium poyangense TaxID=2204302 RepID=UPI0014242E95|nr:carboxypeptidase-like regulatory domain-containing protein [Flavobacterium sp. JXAS1]
MRILKWKKQLIIILPLLMFQFGLSQSRVLVVFDKLTGFAVDNAMVTFRNQDERTFTNSEGKASIIIGNAGLKISKIGFEDLVLETEKELKSDTVFMIRQAVELDELVIKSFNLNKAIQYVLDNYKDLYVHTPFEKECNFKETVVVDNQLKRLIVSKVNWWDRTYEFQKNSRIKLRLGAIAYNKNIPLDIYTDMPGINESNSGYIKPSSLINTIYLNSCLSDFIKSKENITGVIEESPSDQIVVGFESDWEITNGISKRTKGKIIFDKKSKAILEFLNRIEYKNKVTKDIVKETKKESVKESTFIAKRLTFYKTENNLFTLKSFEGTAEVLITYDSKIHPVVFENSIYVLKETAIAKVNNEGLINLSKPIYKSLPAGIIASTNTILLNKQESDFINSK